LSWHIILQCVFITYAIETTFLLSFVILISVSKGRWDEIIEFIWRNFQVEEWLVISFSNVTFPPFGLCWLLPCMHLSEYYVSGVWSGVRKNLVDVSNFCLSWCLWNVAYYTTCVGHMVCFFRFNIYLFNILELHML